MLLFVIFQKRTLYDENYVIIDSAPLLLIRGRKQIQTDGGLSSHFIRRLSWCAVGRAVNWSTRNCVCRRAGVAASWYWVGPARCWPTTTATYPPDENEKLNCWPLPKSFLPPKTTTSGLSYRTQRHPARLLTRTDDSLAADANTGSGPPEISPLPRLRASQFKNENIQNKAINQLFFTVCNYILSDWIPGHPVG